MSKIKDVYYSFDIDRSRAASPASQTFEERNLDTPENFEDMRISFEIRVGHIKVTLTDGSELESELGMDPYPFVENEELFISKIENFEDIAEKLGLQIQDDLERQVENNLVLDSDIKIVGEIKGFDE